MLNIIFKYFMKSYAYVIYERFGDVSEIERVRFSDTTLTSMRKYSRKYYLTASDWVFLLNMLY